MTDNIKAVMIFEILGKPAEHIIQTISEIINKLGEEKGVKVIKKNIQEAKKVEDSDLFTSFAEVEIEAENLQKLISLIFAYMPAHIEILSPSELKMKNFDLNLVCNELITKLHAYDGVAKTLMFEKNNLASQLKQLTGQVPEINQIAKEKVKKSKGKKKKKR